MLSLTKDLKSIDITCHDLNFNIPVEEIVKMNFSGISYGKTFDANECGKCVTTTGSAEKINIRVLPVFSSPDDNIVDTRNYLRKGIKEIALNYENEEEVFVIKDNMFQQVFIDKMTNALDIIINKRA